MVNVLVPIAGHSSRFPNLNPKWSLTHPRGYMMVVEALRGLDMGEVEGIYIIGLTEHDQKFELVRSLSAQFDAVGLGKKIDFVLLDQRTASQPESVAAGIRQASISGPIYIKDSDNYFEDKPAAANSVSGFDLHSLETVNARSKSYFETNADGFVTNIVEKQIVSSKFCAGGYSFEQADEFLRYFDRHSHFGSELYISSLIYGMILDNIAFTSSAVGEYRDWGTLKEWQLYTSQYSTLFVDLDGVLVENSSQYRSPQWGTTDAITENVEVLNQLYDTGKVYIVITTSRKESFRQQTIDQLDRWGMRYGSIIFDLPHSKRVVINDYAPSNPFKSCDAINIKRNSPDLKEMLEDSIGLHLERRVDDRDR